MFQIANWRVFTGSVTRFVFSASLTSCRTYTPFFLITNIGRFSNVYQSTHACASRLVLLCFPRTPSLFRKWRVPQSLRTSDHQSSNCSKCERKPQSHVPVPGCPFSPRKLHNKLHEASALLKESRSAWLFVVRATLKIERHTSWFTLGTRKPKSVLTLLSFPWCFNSSS